MKKKTDLDKALRNDFKEWINCEINYKCECDRYSHEEGVCRQGCVISDVQISSIDLYGISRYIFTSSTDVDSEEFRRIEKVGLLLNGYDSRLDIYGIERILNKSRMYDIANWNYNIINGYYGQEISKILIVDEVLITIKEHILHLLGIITIQEKIKFILENEYGHFLEILNDCSFRISYVERDNIIFGQQNRLTKVRDKNIYKSRDKKNIMGICLRENDKFRVIDGYNRLSQTKHKQVLIIEAYYE